MLNKTEFSIQKIALELAISEKQNYLRTDIELILNTINLIKNNFPKRGEITINKKMLSSKETTVWICECNKRNDIDIKHCQGCKKDIYGFSIDEIQPTEVIAYLEDTIGVLEEIIN